MRWDNDKVNWQKRDKDGVSLIEKAVALRDKQGLSAKEIGRELQLPCNRTAVIGALYRYDHAPPKDQKRPVRAYRRNDHAMTKEVFNPIRPAHPKPPQVANNIIALPSRDASVAPINAPAPALAKPKKATILIKANGKVHANEHLTAECCRWPVGDPCHDDFHFCGAQRVPGKPYCDTHLSRSVQRIRSEDDALAEARSVKKTPILEPT